MTPPTPSRVPRVVGSRPCPGPRRRCVPTNPRGRDGPQWESARRRCSATVWRRQRKKAGGALGARDVPGAGGDDHGTVGGHRRVEGDGGDDV